MPYIHSPDYLVFERLREQQHEVEQQRLLARSRKPEPGPSRLQHLIGSLGTFLVTLGTKLQQVEQRREHAV